MKGRVATIGFGEVGSRFARDLSEAGASRIFAFDIADAARVRARLRGDHALRKRRRSSP